MFCVQYICEIRRRLANRAAAVPGSLWEEHFKSPFVFASLKKNSTSYIRNFKAQRGMCETCSDTIIKLE